LHVLLNYISFVGVFRFTFVTGVKQGDYEIV